MCSMGDATTPHLQLAKDISSSWHLGAALVSYVVGRS